MRDIYKRISRYAELRGGWEGGGGGGVGCGSGQG